MARSIPEILADLARPSVLWFGGVSASSATVIGALNASLESAAVVAAAWTGLGGIYWAKAHEQAKVETANVAARAEVDKKQLEVATPPIPPPDPAAPPPERE